MSLSVEVVSSNKTKAQPVRAISKFLGKNINERSSFIKTPGRILGGLFGAGAVVFGLKNLICQKGFSYETPIGLLKDWGLFSLSTVGSIFSLILGFKGEEILKNENINKIKADEEDEVEFDDQEEEEEDILGDTKVQENETRIFNVVRPDDTDSEYEIRKGSVRWVSDSEDSIVKFPFKKSFAG